MNPLGADPVFTSGEASASIDQPRESWNSIGYK